MTDKKKVFYVTTPIYYVNDIPHVGHAYCTIGADAIARFKRMDGWDVYFLTGTDEHGQKIAKTAREKGLEPKALADQVVERFKALWIKLNISNDDFIRTTDERHKKACVEFFRKVAEGGFIEKKHYEGWYCLPDEKFLLDSEVVDAKCPDCGRPVERLTEENYFFLMSRFQKALEDHLAAHPDFVQPDSRKNELVNNFIKPGLSDVSITRNTVKWGIRAPVPEETVIYVWFDALLNYITALGWPDGEKYRKYWCGEGADEHESVNVIGKDILRFHATIWPTMLMAAGAPLPTRVFGTGYITSGGQKMSKSLGNVVNPMDVIDRYGVDALRYYLLRTVPFGFDGSFTQESFELTFNGDLANDLGNLLHRSLTMIEKYFGGVIPQVGESLELKNKATDYINWARRRMSEPTQRQVEHIEDIATSPTEVDLNQSMQFHAALSQLWDVIKMANKYIEVSAPWKVAKERNDAKLGEIMYVLAETLRIVAIHLTPYMPSTAQAMWEQLGYQTQVKDQRFVDTEKWGLIPPGQKIAKGAPLFPRIEKNK